MHKSKIAPIVAGIFIFVGAALWIWNILTIDYSKMKGQGPQSSVVTPAVTPADSKQGQP